MYRQILFTFILFFSFTSIIGAKTINMDEFLKAYLEKSKALKDEFWNTKKAAGTVKKSTGIDDIRTKLNGGYTYAKGSATPSVYGYDSTAIYGISLSADKVVSETGTRLSVSHGLNLNDMKEGYFFTPPTTKTLIGDMSKYGTSVAFSVIQPILKNFLGLQDRFPYISALIAEKMQKIQFEEKLESEMVNGVAMYLNWIYLIQQKRILNENIADNLVVLKDTEARVKAGIAEMSDLEVARENVILIQNTLLEIENAYQIALLNMRKYIAINNEDLPDEKALDKTMDLKAKAIEGIRPIQVLELMKKQYDLILETKKNAILPDLNLIASYKLSGADESLSSSYRGLKTSEFFLGFEFILPFFNSAASGDLDETRAEYQKVLEAKIETEKDIRIAEKTLKNSFITYQKLLEEQKKYILSIEKKSKDETKQYKQGILSLREIARTSIDLANARLKLTEYTIKYHNAFYQYLGLMDEIIALYSNCIPENDKTNGLKPITEEKKK